MLLKKRLFFIVSSLFVVFLTACGDDSDDSTNELPELVEVEIQTDPEENLQPGEAFTIKSIVTQGDEPVNDADEVRLEFWKEGTTDEEHESFDGEFQADGVYTKEFTVDEPGIYCVISHVTARDIHTMPRKALFIGDVEVPENTADLCKNQQSGEHGDHGEDHEEGHAEEHGDHASSDVAIHIMVDEVVPVNQEVSLMGHLQIDEQPLTEARVEFEIWKDGAEKHEYIPASEENEGEYKAAFTFEEAGDYHINLHVEKDEIHDHKEVVIKAE